MSEIDRTKPLPQPKPAPGSPGVAPGAAAASLEGRVLAERYRVGPRLAVGGVGAVYEALHVPTGRELAIKTLLPGKERAAELVRRFEREAKAHSLLDHPHIVEVLDLGALDDGTLYLVMELVRGRSLRELLDAGAGPMGARRSLLLARQVLDALAHAHARGLVHRDLKPDNIMVTRVAAPGGAYEHVKLVDFGLVKAVGDAVDELGDAALTQRGLVFGTPAYMAPEQALGMAVDGRTDLYALGIVLFELLTARLPFADGDAMTLMRQHIAQPPPPLAHAAPPGALAKKPEQRFADAGAMIAALDVAFASLDHLPVEPPAP